LPAQNRVGRAPPKPTHQPKHRQAAVAPETDGPDWSKSLGGKAHNYGFEEPFPETLIARQAIWQIVLAENFATQATVAYPHRHKE
jgi:hypothetical protein